MPKLPPVALILFSNDLARFLPNVEKERKLIEEALEHYNDTNRMKVITRSAVTPEEIFRLFNRYRGRIVLFHFAGHAGGEGLQLNESFTDNTTAKKEGLQDLFKREVSEGILKFIFLNGCSTVPQVQGLKAANVPAIIATHFQISDNKAVRFAHQFYRSLAQTDSPNPFEGNRTTLSQAFKDALAYLKTVFTVEVTETTRGFTNHIKEMPGEAWELFSEIPDWHLPFETAEEQKTFNEFITRRLIEDIVPFSRSAEKFLPKANEVATDWETQSRIADKAKEVLIYSFVGVLGLQLQELMAIGKRDASASKPRLYLETALFTTKRVLKMLCFALISKLWDYRKISNSNEDFKLTDVQKTLIKKLFTATFELNVQEYLNLLKALFEVYKTNHLAFPITELNDFDQHLAEDSPFVKACERMNDLNQTLDKSKFELSDCFTAERQLSTILGAVNFFASYKMLSIKNIVYDEARNSPPRYIHNYTALGFDIKRNPNKAQTAYENSPINTEAILLYKGRFQESVNLFPFMIDMNVLTFEEGSKICFYDSREVNDNSLNYRFLEDNKLKNIVLNDTLKKEKDDLNAIFSDREKHKNYRLDTVYQQFEAAQEVILGEVLVEEDPFSDIFNEED